MWQYYSRVNTTRTEQIESLSNQIEYYKQMVSNHIDWVLVDIYVDIQSGKSTSKKPELQRMLEHCINNKIDLIITKSVSRFGRNTAFIIAKIMVTLLIWWSHPHPPKNTTACK
jgi:DNA invertase Pin-like site-specific DNA recombinase